MATQFDVIVIGSGGGSKITRPAANLGNKVAIIEKGRLGGTCLNHGCIPSKMLIHPAEVVSEIKSAKKFDIDVDSPKSIYFDRLVERVNKTIDKESFGIAPAYEKHPNITFYADEAKFISDKVIEVGGETLTADKIFICVGARASIPNIPGLAGTPYMTYKEALRNTTLPKKMLVLGGGYIATELGYCYGELGCEVEFLVRSVLLRNEDEEISEAFTQSFKRRFPVHFGHMPSEIRYENGQFEVDCEERSGKKDTLTADALLVATGVRPNTDLLNLDATQIKLDHHGNICVNDHLETNVPGVYAFGDVLGRHLYRHTANYEGEYLFQNVFLKESPDPIEYPPIPHAVFSNPQIAGVGATEKELIDAGIPYVSGVNAYEKSAMGMALLSDEGFCKLLVHRDTRQLIGAHIIGRESSNMIHMLIAYMKMKATIDDMLDTIYIHPALPEIVRNAARKAAVNLARPE